MMRRLIPERLRGFPQVSEHNWLIHDYMYDFLRSAASHAKGRLVDIGCGDKPWRAIFEDRVNEHVGVDLADADRGNGAVDVYGTAYRTTLPDEWADTVLCTEVLEHLEDPPAAVREMRRILVPGGTVILTVPLFWQIHEAPRDFYRYTPFGLRHLFEDAGFEVLEIRPLAGFFVTVGQMFVYYNRRFARGRVLRSVARLTNWALQHLFKAVDRWDRSPEFSSLHGLVARKRAGASETPSE